MEYKPRCQKYIPSDVNSGNSENEIGSIIGRFELPDKVCLWFGEKLNYTVQVWSVNRHRGPKISYRKTNEYVDISDFCRETVAECYEPSKEISIETLNRASGMLPSQIVNFYDGKTFKYIIGRIELSIPVKTNFAQQYIIVIEQNNLLLWKYINQRYTWKKVEVVEWSRDNEVLLQFLQSKFNCITA